MSQKRREREEAGQYKRRAELIRENFGEIGFLVKVAYGIDHNSEFYKKDMPETFKTMSFEEVQLALYYANNETSKEQSTSSELDKILSALKDVCQAAKKGDIKFTMLYKNSQAQSAWKALDGMKASPTHYSHEAMISKIDRVSSKWQRAGPPSKKAKLESVNLRQFLKSNQGDIDRAMTLAVQVRPNSEPIKKVKQILASPGRCSEKQVQAALTGVARFLVQQEAKKENTVFNGNEKEVLPRLLQNMEKTDFFKPIVDKERAKDQPLPLQAGHHRGKDN